MAAQLAGVFIAGGAGATLRVLLAGRVERALGERLPFAGILAVNLLGCLAIGFGAASISAPHWQAIVLGGLLGGFTTYSSFALLSVALGEDERWGVLATQIGAHLFGGVGCVWAGFSFARLVGVAAS